MHRSPWWDGEVSLYYSEGQSSIHSPIKNTDETPIIGLPPERGQKFTVKSRIYAPKGTITNNNLWLPRELKNGSGSGACTHMKRSSPLRRSQIGNPKAPASGKLPQGRRPRLNRISILSTDAGKSHRGKQNRNMKKKLVRSKRRIGTTRCECLPPHVSLDVPTETNR